MNYFPRDNSKFDNLLREVVEAGKRFDIVAASKKQTIEDMQTALQFCFAPSGNRKLVNGELFTEYFVPEAEVFNGPSKSKIKFKDMGIKEVQQGHDGVFKVRLQFGSWIAFDRMTKKAVVFEDSSAINANPEDDGKAKRHAEIVAKVFMLAAEWTAYPGSPNIIDGGKCTYGGPTEDQIETAVLPVFLLRKKPSLSAELPPVVKIDTREPNEFTIEIAPLKIPTTDVRTPASQNRALPSVFNWAKKHHPELWGAVIAAVAKQKLSDFAEAGKATTARQSTRIVSGVKSAANKTANVIKDKAPAMLAGAVIGAGIRTVAHAGGSFIASHFGLAAISLTVPGFVAAVAASPVTAIVVSVGSAVALGAIAGGVTKVAVTAMFDKQKTQQAGWKWKAFKQGAAYGAIGGAIGWEVAQHLKLDEVVHNLMSKFAPAPAHIVPQPVLTPTPQLINVSAPHAVPDNAVVPEAKIIPAPSTAAAAPAITAAAPAQATVAVPDAKITLRVDTSPQAATSVAPAAEVIPVTSIVPKAYEGLLSDDQFKSLPEKLQKLATSEKIHDVLRFSKDASALLDQTHTAVASKSSVGLLEYALKAADEAHVVNHVVKQLHADAAYHQAWGIGTEKDTTSALGHARHAGKAIRNYGPRLIRMLHTPKVA